MVTQMSRRGAAMLIGSEAIVPYRYKDSAGFDTEGIGHTAGAGAPDPAKRPFGQEIPLEEVVRTFRRDLRKFEKRVNDAVVVPLRQHQFDGLAHFDFNTGGIHRAKLTEKLNAGDVAGAAAAFDGWHRPPEIIPRRNAEKALFRNGTYAHGGMATVYPADGRGRVQWSQGRRIDVMPIVDEVFAANADEKAAGADIKNAGAASAGGAASGTGGGNVAPDPLAAADPAFLKWLLIGLAIVLALAALRYGISALRRRRSARRRDRDVGEELGIRIAAGVPVDATEPEPFLGKAPQGH